jgi:hypothetical protein
VEEHEEEVGWGEECVENGDEHLEPGGLGSHHVYE